MRQPIFNIYGFVRLADEIVDTFHDYDKATLLEELKKEQKDKNLSEDDLKKNSNEVQKITDTKIAEIDKKLSEKEVEILQAEKAEHLSPLGICRFRTWVVMLRLAPRWLFLSAL